MAITLWFSHKVIYQSRNLDYKKNLMSSTEDDPLPHCSCPIMLSYLECSTLHWYIHWLGKYGWGWAENSNSHDDVIKWKHFSLYWPFVRGIHLSSVDSPQKGQWRRALMFSLICAWTNGWANNHDAGDLRCHRAHYDVILMLQGILYAISTVESLY